MNVLIDWGLGIGDWGLGIGDLGIGPNPQSPIPNPHDNYKKNLFEFHSHLTI